MQIETEIKNAHTQLELPQYYTEILPANTKMPEYPLQKTNTCEGRRQPSRFFEAEEWLKQVRHFDTNDETLPLIMCLGQLLMPEMPRKKVLFL